MSPNMMKLSELQMLYNIMYTMTVDLNLAINKIDKNVKSKEFQIVDMFNITYNKL